jgi:hypothetical protein
MKERKSVKNMDRDDLKLLHRQLERLQADIEAGEWIWRDTEKDALATVMDAVKDTYSLPPLKRSDG